ncbi:unnamed protein product [Polarella glacialis]|uniref:Uncharacterized protein n=1 Tax=Polarella glacialis TaxID=89957 RepID=A0A813LZP3_POLGL|nr:unnamed protein product [Polarella glacialis]
MFLLVVLFFCLLKAGAGELDSSTTFWLLAMVVNVFAAVFGDLYVMGSFFLIFVMFVRNPVITDVVVVVVVAVVLVVVLGVCVVVLVRVVVLIVVNVVVIVHPVAF